MLSKMRQAAIAAAIFYTAIGSASAAPVLYDVYAGAHSANRGNGSGLSVGNVTLDQDILLSVDANDLWSAGLLPRWSNAEGLVRNFYASGSDESGRPHGELIGKSYAPLTIPSFNFTAPYGALVGEIAGKFQIIGLGYNGKAWGSGMLRLFYWDENYEGNADNITVSVDLKPNEPIPAPEPAALGLLCLGAFAVGLRRRYK